MPCCAPQCLLPSRLPCDPGTSKKSNRSVPTAASSPGQCRDRQEGWGAGLAQGSPSKSCVSFSEDIQGVNRTHAAQVEEQKWTGPSQQAGMDGGTLQAAPP